MKSCIVALLGLTVTSFTACGGGGGTQTPSPSSPPPASYTIGGTVTGLSGTGLVLQDNTSDSLTLNANGSFTFPSPVTSGTAYNVSILTQPSNPSQSCTVTNGNGTATANVTTIQVGCTTTTSATYTISGTVSNLSGAGLVLQYNGANNLAITANGNFAFTTAIAGGSTYTVSVLTQPSNPTQSCLVTNGMGTANANVTNVQVTCTTTTGTTYTIGGSVSGLSGTGLVLQDNGGNNLSINANGSFTFTAAVSSTYEVTVLTQPSNPSQNCLVANGNGTATANVTNVQVTCAASNGNTITLSFFGADFLLTGLTWPGTDSLGQVATLGGLRLWDDDVKWGQINTAANTYDWTQLDSWISMAQGQNLDVLYTFGVTPQFDATLPPPSIHCVGPTIYGCSAPNDVNPNGTGTDATFSAFVTALVTRYKGEIAFYELWNEPDCTCYFDGTDAQLVRMGTDASNIIHSIDPDALVLSPSYHVWTLTTFWDPYLAAGGAATFDIVNFHMRGTGTLNEVPESFLGTYASIEANLQTNNLADRPLWDSEHGIKADESLPSTNEQAGFAAREVALRAGVGLPRQYMYAWDDVPPVGFQDDLAGTAWNTIASWLIGHSISPCTASGAVYTCNVDDGQIVWDTSQSCSNGVCTYSNYTYPSSYAWQTNLLGSKTALSGKTVPIGYEPIFLTAQ
jgi:hypothetical protein